MLTVLVALTFVGAPPLYRDARQPMAARLDDLVAQLTPRELLAQLSGPRVVGVGRLNISGAAFMGECLAGLGSVNISTSWPMPVALSASFDEALVARVAGAMASEARGHRNTFGAWRPGSGGDLPPYGTGWDSTCLVPQLNVYRDPRWGRNYETLGESPLVIARLGASVIRGLQGCESQAACDAATARGEPMKLAAVGKHLAAYNLECYGPNTYPTCGWSRHSFDAAPSPRDLNTSYLRQWRDAVSAGMQGAMCSYNSISGVPACADADLLQKKLRNEWGCRECMVISDAGAVDGVWGCDRPGQAVLHDRPCHNYTHSTLSATAAALNAGCDLDYGHAYADNLAAATASAATTIASVKASVKNVFRLRLLTQMEPSLTDPSTISQSAKKYTDIPFSVVDSIAHRQLAREAAAGSCVLMVNHEKTLPIRVGSGLDTQGRAAAVVDLAVIGEHTGGEWTRPITDGCYRLNATDETHCTPFWQVVPAEILGGAYRGTPSRIDSILGSLQQRVQTASSLRLAHAPGVRTGCPAPACDGAD